VQASTSVYSASTIHLQLQCNCRISIQVQYGFSTTRSTTTASESNPCLQILFNYVSRSRCRKRASVPSRACRRLVFPNRASGATRINVPLPPSLNVESTLTTWQPCTCKLFNLLHTLLTGASYCNGSHAYDHSKRPQVLFHWIDNQQHPLSKIARHVINVQKRLVEKTETHIVVRFLLHQGISSLRISCVMVYQHKPSPLPSPPLSLRQQQPREHHRRQGQRSHLLLPTGPKLEQLSVQSTTDLKGTGGRTEASLAEPSAIS
jgi:hypothetical protein